MSSTSSLLRLRKAAERLVGAALPRNAAQHPQGFAEPQRKSGEALPSKHYPGVDKSRPGETEVIELVIKTLAGNGDLKRVHRGEVGDPHAPRFLFLTEYHILVSALLSPPCLYTPLKSPANSGVEPGVPSHYLAEHRAGAYIRTVLENGCYLGIENVLERVGPAAPPRLALLPRPGFEFLFDRKAGCAAKTRLGGRDLY